MGRIRTLALSAAVVAGAAVAIDARAADHQVSLLRNHFRLPADDAAFSLDLIADLPEPVQRYFAHAIAPGTLLARSVRLLQTGRMQPKPGADHVELRARQTLAPPLGMVWEARMRFGPMPFSVVDCHFQGAGRVEGRVAGLLAVMRAEGVHVSRSSRHRVAMEAMWVPSVLLPQHGTAWSVVDDDHIRYEITIDRELVPVTLRIDDDGRVLEATMERYGDVGVPEFRPLPYGFEVVTENTFGGYTVPSRLVGGWWYGTDQFDPAGASEFELHDAVY